MNPRRYFLLIAFLLLGGWGMYLLLFNDPRPKPSFAVYSSSKTDNGVTVSLSNIRMVNWSPQWRMLLVNICVDDPNHNSLGIDGKIIYPNGEKEINRGLSSKTDPACYDYDFSFSPDDDLSKLEFVISSITNYSYHFNKTLSCAMINEEQRILDDWNTKIKVSCKENDSSGDWIRQIDYVPPEITNANEWIIRASNIARDKFLITHGKWDFLVKESEIYNYPVLTLLEPSAPVVIQQDFNVTASNLRSVIVPAPLLDETQRLKVDVCINTPNSSRWGVWNAVLEYGGGKIKRRFFINEGDKDSCKTMSFNISPNQIVSRARLYVFGISFYPNMENEEKCNEYLPKLQQAISNKYFGLYIKCVPTSDERGWWGINYSFKPAWMSELDTRTLIASQELYTVKGDWEFDLEIIP